MKLHKFIILAGLFLLPACADFNSISRSHDFNGGSSKIIDAKQRGIISVEQVKIDKYGSKKVKHIICAEPSPDALTALATSSEIEGGDGKIKARLATALRESAGSIGLRTQTIQMLRDDKYRLCEAYANGAIDKVEYRFLLRQSQKNMLALLATEQLTGAISAPAITLNSGTTNAGATQGNGTSGDSKLNEISVITQNTPPKDVATVAKSVERIVNTLNKKDDNISFCMMEYQRAMRNERKVDVALEKACGKVVSEELEESKNNISDASCGLSPTTSVLSSSSTGKDPLGG